jgi:hypothetical protein
VSQRKKEKAKPQSATATAKKGSPPPVVSTDQLIRGLVGLFVLVVALRVLGLL